MPDLLGDGCDTSLVFVYLVLEYFSHLLSARNVPIFLVKGYRSLFTVNLAVYLYRRGLGSSIMRCGGRGRRRDGDRYRRLQFDR